MLDRIESNTLRQLFLYWDEKRGHRRAPSRDDIDPAGICEVLSSVFLIDVEAETVFRWALPSNKENGRGALEAPRP